MYTATYSPEDNKLRFYSATRLDLDKETYERIRAAGFKWAPKQDLFVAPMWTPEREDLLIELCGEIDDEDTSLVERAEQRAKRFAEYGEHREADAEQAHATVARIVEHIPFGQPILVGHHSERRARKDVERIDANMRKAVSMWKQSEYWQRRAKSALLHAKYKERPDVRARRIKGLEADKRKQESIKVKAVLWLNAWSREGLTLEQAIKIANVCWLLRLPRKEGDREDFPHTPTAYDALTNGYPSLYAPRSLDEVITAAKEMYPRTIAKADRWIEHYSNRIAYEKAMLEEEGGIATSQTGPEKGGACKCWAGRGAWLWIQKVNKTSVTILDNWGNGGENFTRTIPFDKISAVLTKAEVDAKREAGLLVENTEKTGFFLRSVTEEHVACVA